jgi:hypothetical protein
MTISQKLFRALLWLAILLNGCYLIVTGVVLPPQASKLFAPVGLVTGFTLLLLAVLNCHLWRWRLVHKLLGAAPDMQGTWKGEIRSQWLNPQTGENPPPIECYMVVRQTLSEISIKVFTMESASDTLATSIIIENGSHQILATYRNTPDLKHRNRSPIHFGGFLLHIIGCPPQTLKGHYWTDRNTQGEICVSHPKANLAESFDTAHNLFGT